MPPLFHSLFTRIRQAWAVLLGRARILTNEIEADVHTEYQRLLDRLMYATLIVKDLPMAIADDINALDAVILSALAAKDTANTNTQAALTAQVTDLTAQLANADAQVQALIAKYTPPAA